MLPYASIAEAEVALVGARPLSSMETLWLRYTASVPDSCVYHVNVLLVFAVFNLAPLPALLLDLKAPTSAAVRRYKLQPAANNAPSAIFRCYKTVMLTFFTVVLPLHLISYPFVEYVGIRTSLPLPSPWEILAQLTVYFLVEDYGHYWIHRWLHTEWAFTNIHYMHHQFTAPVGFAAPYAHWAEILLLGLPSFVGPSLVPGHVITLWLWFALRQMEAIEIHSGYKFPWVPTKLIPLYGGSEYHDYHHFVGRNAHSNFASIFVYCDYIYGTNKGYYCTHEKRRRIITSTLKASYK